MTAAERKEVQMAETKRGPGRPPGSKNKNSGTKAGGKASSAQTSKAKEKAQEIQARKKADKRVIDEIWAIIAIAIGAFLIVAIFTGGAGRVGEIIGDSLKGVFGHMAYILPFYLIIFGVLLFARKTSHFSLKTVGLLMMILLMFATMNSVRYLDTADLTLKWELVQQFYATGIKLMSGGFVGMILATLLVKWFGVAGCWIFTIVLTLICLLLLINTPVSRFFEKIGDKIEEKKLIKEHAHLDISSEDEQGVQLAMRPELIIKQDRPQSEAPTIIQTSAGREADISDTINMVNGADTGSFTNNAGTVQKPKKRIFAPPLSLASKTAKTDKNKQNTNTVLQYMQDDALFQGNANGTGGYGLEEQRQVRPGYGIDGDTENDSRFSKSFGLNPNGDSAVLNSARGSVGAAAQSFDVQTAENTANSVQSAGKELHTPKISHYNSDSGNEPQFAEDNRQLTFVTRDSVKAANHNAAANTQNNAAFDKEPVEKISNKEAREAMLTADEINKAQPVKQYKKPSVSLLEKPSGGNSTPAGVLQAKAMKLEETLKNFHVDARVIQVTQGPTVTRYEIQPAVGVKVSSIVRLSDDIALNLEAKSIRIEAPIPGKAAVGIEVENDSVTMVRLREIIDSDNFKKAKSKITFAVGKDISGNAIVADLKSMPHLLIAGSTGSGKSVCINSIITSFIYKANPDEVKLILIDPKVVELGNYNGIPHLMIPVVTDPTKAAAALNWAVAEMTDRYKKFAESGVRDLESYNEFVKANDEADKVMPQVVIIIDEFADLMMAAPSQIEESICRLAQMARAAGMHLIVATQRPSVDVITGVIKANIPSRIAFAVSSQVDSRTILDMQGAEKLVGKGDMLFNPMGMGKPIRVQGTFVSDGEVHKVIEFVKGQVESTEYNEEVLTRIERSNVQDSQDDEDELLPDAIDLVVSSGQASVSMLQRRFRIGYNRAARIVDMMEARGIIGPQDGSRPRQVLVTAEELAETQNELKDITGEFEER